MNELINSLRPDDSEERQHTSAASAAFKPQDALLRLAAANLYRKNPFRILGLYVDATSRELSRHIERIKLEIELGAGSQHKHRPNTPGSLLDDDTLRDCVQTLREPISRFGYEYFWFWPEEWKPAGEDVSLQAINAGNESVAIDAWLQREKSGDIAAAHNLAVFFHFRALENHANGESAGPWRESYRRWRHLIDQDEYWDFFALRVKALNEPQVTLGLLRCFRDTLPVALAKIGLEIAISDTENGNFEIASEVICITKEGPGESAAWWKAVEIVSRPLRNRIEHSVGRASELTSANMLAAPFEIPALIKAVKVPVRTLEMLYGANNEEYLQTSDLIVTTVITAAVAYQKKTGDNNGLLNLLETAKTVICSKEVAERLSNNERIARNNIAYAVHILPLENAILAANRSSQKARAKLKAMRQQPFAHLARIQREAPLEIYKQACMVLAAALRSLSIDAFNDENDFDTAAEAINTAMPLAKDDSEATKQLAADLDHIARSRPVKRNFAAAIAHFALGNIRLTLAIVTLVALAILARSSDKNKPSQSQSSPRSQVPASTTNGQYSIPRNMSSQFRAKKERIQQLESQIQYSSNAVERARVLLDTSDQFAVDRYNEMVERHNSLIVQHDFLVDQYNSELQRYGRPR